MQASKTHHRAASASHPVRISLENVTLRVRDRFLLPGTWWKIRPGQNWVIVGPNGSGKTSLMRCLVGEVPAVAGRIVRSWAPGEDCPVAYVGFEQQWRWLRREERLAEARCFSGQAGAGTTVAEVLGPYRLEASTGCMDLGSLLERSIGHLSTGEARRVLVARALSNRPQLLVLDEPFSGLDGAGRRMLGNDIRRFIHQGMQILLVTHRPEEVPAGFFHLLRVENDRVEALAWNGGHCARARLKPERSTPGQLESRRQAEPSGDPPLVEFRNVTVRYGDTVVLGSLSWTFRRGRHWAVTGPNGSGKSTILRLIYAELSQAYANDITVFGKKRGTGETIWEIKRNIGMVGTEGQLNYRKSIPAEKVVLSGFTDSIGFYRYARSSELQAARRWMRALGIEELSAVRYDRLSYGQQRLVLLARALVKSPQLLLLDEPCQGLDPENRHRVLSTIESIGTRTATHLLFVTHHEKELPACIHRVMRIGKPVCGRTPVVFHRRQDS